MTFLTETHDGRKAGPRIEASSWSEAYAKAAHIGVRVSGELIDEFVIPDGCFLGSALLSGKGE